MQTVTPDAPPEPAADRTLDTPGRSLRPRFRRRPLPAAPVSMGRVLVRLYRPGVEGFLEVAPAQISEVIQEPGTLLWVDIRDPIASDLEMLGEEFGFSALSLEDAGKQRQRPKVDAYPGYYFVVIYAPVHLTPQREVRTVEVDLFIGPNYLISLHRDTVPALDDALKRWHNTEPETRGRVGFLTHTLLDSIIDAYFPVVDDLDDRLDNLELSMFQAGRSANPEELLVLKRSLFALRKAIYPLREAFTSFPQSDQAIFGVETHPYFQDVYDHILRLLDILDVQQEMIGGAMEAHLAFISNQLNETMKTLTVVGICVAIAGAVFGAWGMNVRGVPMSTLTIGHTYVGFWAVCILTLILIALALGWAHRRGAT